MYIETAKNFFLREKGVNELSIGEREMLFHVLSGAVDGDFDLFLGDIHNLGNLTVVLAFEVAEAHTGALFLWELCHQGTNAADILLGVDMLVGIDGTFGDGSWLGIERDDLAGGRTGVVEGLIAGEGDGIRLDILYLLPAVALVP